MKKFVALLLALSVCVSLAGCHKDTGMDDADRAGNAYGEHGGDIDPNRTKLKGVIKNATVFYYDRAAAKVGDTWYCIDKNGGIIFQYPSEVTVVTRLFENGYSLVNEGYCDDTGRYTTFQDMGIADVDATTCRYQGDYLIARVDESTYNSKVLKLGILNSDFEWQVEPSMELYEALERDYGTTYPLRTSQKYVYNEEKDHYVDLTTGKVLKDLPEEDQYMIRTVEYGVAYDARGNELCTYPEGASVTPHTDGTALLVYYSGDKRFFSIADKNGAMLFEPIEALNYPGSRSAVPNIAASLYDEYVVVSEYDGAEAKIYDFSGKLLATLTNDINVGGRDERNRFTYSVSSGMVLVQEMKNYTYHYYDFDGNLIA